MAESVISICFCTLKCYTPDNIVFYSVYTRMYDTFCLKFIVCLFFFNMVSRDTILASFNIHFYRLLMMQLCYNRTLTMNWFYNPDKQLYALCRVDTQGKRCLSLLLIIYLHQVQQQENIIAQFHQQQNFNQIA